MKFLNLIAAGLLSTSGLALAGPLGPAPVNPYSPAPANGGWYFGLNGGFLWMEDVEAGSLDFDFDTGWSAIGAFGYQFGNGFALGLGAGYLRGEFESVSGYGHQLGVSADLHMAPLTVNASYTLKFTDVVGLYFGGGLGGAWSELNGDSIQGIGIHAKADDWNLVWQARAGLGFDVNPALSLNVGYRYVNILDGVAGYDDAAGHMAEAGIKVRF